MSDRVGVMSQGRLKQVADPREIYNNPVNGFVASFVGENNIFTGDIQNASEGMAQFATTHGTFRARLVAGASGKNAKLYIRPEHVTFADQPAAENSLPVTVGDVSFEGNFISVHAVSDSGAPFVAELRNDGSASVPAPGSRLHAHFDAARASILPDGDGA